MSIPDESLLAKKAHHGLSVVVDERNQSMSSIPANNFEWLKANTYPGRGLIIGTNGMGQTVQVYFLTGRSTNSRNRVFSLDGDRLFTEAADPSQMTDPSLIIYNAMMARSNAFVVSNGAQTDVIAKALETMGPVAQIRFANSQDLKTSVYEPDTPNFTPRISGVSYLNPIKHIWQHAICIARKNSALDIEKDCTQTYFEFEDMPAGFGFGITTYMGDGNPLPAYIGEPRLLPLEGTSEEILDTYWGTLPQNLRVAIAVREMDRWSGQSRVLIKNQFTGV